jgi:hypothetical protein
MAGDILKQWKQQKEGARGLDSNGDVIVALLSSVNGPAVL